ncbi:MAG: cupredoxin domain-containing protein [Candidatus Levybacteria bacterium]|nr:cupredoxin domain-containing protein [Candidatus Levybacteria bacterium]
MKKLLIPTLLAILLVITASLLSSFLKKPPIEKDPIVNTVRPGKAAAEKNPPEKTIEMKDFTFIPKIIKVNKGTKISWINKDKIEHSATADDKTFDTKLIREGNTESLVVTKTGKITYHCSSHPNMTGEIHVE